MNRNSLVTGSEPVGLRVASPNSVRKLNNLPSKQGSSINMTPSSLQKKSFNFSGNLNKIGGSANRSASSKKTAATMDGMTDGDSSMGCASPMLSPRHN